MHPRSAGAIQSNKVQVIIMPLLPENMRNEVEKGRKIKF